MICCGMYFFGFTLFVDIVLSWTYRFMYHSSKWEFSAIISSNTLLTFLFSLFLRIWWYGGCIFSYYSTGLCSFFSACFFFFFFLVFRLSSVTQLCPTFCNPMNCSMLPFTVKLPELAHSHVHRISNTIQPSHPLSSSSPPAFNLSQN